MNKPLIAPSMAGMPWTDSSVKGDIRIKWANNAVNNVGNKISLLCNPSQHALDLQEIMRIVGIENVSGIGVENRPIRKSNSMHNHSICKEIISPDRFNNNFRPRFEYICSTWNDVIKRKHKKVLHTIFNVIWIDCVSPIKQSDIIDYSNLIKIVTDDVLYFTITVGIKYNGVLLDNVLNYKNTQYNSLEHVVNATKEILIRAGMECIHINPIEYINENSVTTMAHVEIYSRKIK